MPALVAAQNHNRCLLCRAAVLSAVVGLALCRQSNNIALTFVNACNGPVDVFWVKHGGMEEIVQFNLPAGHQNKVQTEAGNVFRAKFSFDNRGIFGQDILEEWEIQDLAHSPDQQEIKFCRKAEL